MNKRLIGNFLEINGDIVKLETESRKNFINKIKFKRMRKKLIDHTKRIKKLNLVLTKDNLNELFYFIWNNYPPNGEFKEIKSTKINHEEDYIESKIEYEDYQIIITIYQDEDDIEFQIRSSNQEDDKKNINISRKDVSDDGEFKSIFETLNSKLLELISDYILEIIIKY
mgnify:CR=1 FL=1